MSIGAYIRSKRKEAGLRQMEVAQRMGGGCTQKDISRWETGVRVPSLDTMIKLSEALDCSVEELLDARENGKG